MGLPYAHPELSVTVRGGTPYGASHVSGVKHQHVMTVDEQALAIAQVCVWRHWSNSCKQTAYETITSTQTH